MRFAVGPPKAVGSESRPFEGQECGEVGIEATGGFQTPIEISGAYDVDDVEGYQPKAAFAAILRVQNLDPAPQRRGPHLSLFLMAILSKR